MKVQLKATCNGVGYWSNQIGRIIELNELIIGYINVENDFGELRAFFTPKSWDIGKDGLIYTDEGWIIDFKKELLRIGFSFNGANDVDYSEQGMQGMNYVSMDFGATFYNDWQSLQSLKEKL